MFRRPPLAGLAALAAIFVGMGLAGCKSAPEDEGPKPGEMRTTEGKPAPPEAANVKGEAPPSNMPPPGGMMKGRRKP